MKTHSKVISFVLAVIISFSVLPVSGLSAIAATDDIDAVYESSAKAAPKKAVTKSTAASENWLWPVPTVKKLTYDRHFKSGHGGIDIPGKNQKVLATKSGKVAIVYLGCNNWSHQGGSVTCQQLGICHPNHSGTYCGMCNDGFGRGVVINHLDGTFSKYAHMSTVNVTLGQEVHQGDVIGTTGAYGNAYGAHLHFSLSKSATGANFNNNPKQLGYSSGVTYVYDIDPPKPVSPKITGNVSGDIAIDSTVIVSWTAISNATGYKVYMNGAQVAAITGTSYSFKATETKKYDVSVYAYNSKYTSEQSNTVSVTAHNPVSVTFVDWNDTPLTKEPLIVPYGGTVIAPDIPVRPGHTFIGWDKPLTNLTDDVIIRPLYKINTYTVRFLDSKSNELSSQKVEYGSAAVAPENKNVPVGYEFLGWNTDAYLDVKEDLTVYGVYDWGNHSLPIVAQLTSATRQDDGYYVHFNLTNYPDAITRGRAVVLLKTAEGKLVDTTESAAFSIPKNGTKTDMEVFIPCEIAATRVELVIVNSYTSGVPISAVVSADISSGLAWTDWSDTAPEEGQYTELEQRTVYRSRDKEFTTDSVDSKDGWTLYDTTSEWGPYGEWSAWSRTAVTANDSTKVETKTVTDTAAYTNYNLFYYRYYNTSAGKYYYTYSSNMGGTRYNKTVKSSEVKYYNTYGNYKAYIKNSGYYNFSGEVWFLSGQQNVAAVTHTEYRSATRSLQYVYHFYRWLDMTDWTTDVIEATADREVETKTQYRYKSAFADAGIENTSGETRTVSGTLDTSLAGKQLSLFVYKIDEASDYTNEFVGQTTVAQDGSYSFTFKLREEPSEKTGDFTVAIGLEGSTNTIIIDTIEAPKPKYSVNFYFDGVKLGETQLVEEGQAAILPSNPEKEGYTFVGWNANTSNIRSNADVDALFVKNKYTVVFADHIAQTVNVREYYYGDMLIAPEVTPVNGYVFLGWNDLPDTNIAVTENLVFTANYDRETYVVKFYDYFNNLVSSQTVPYGESAIVPEAPEESDMTFQYWDSSEDFLDVKEDIIVRASYLFEETCETPVANVLSGEYAQTQYVTLTSATQNAVIFYTLDGTDPRSVDVDSTAAVYSAPIEIGQSCELKFYATAMNMNDSEVVTQTYAINNGNTESGLMLFEDIPELVMNNLDKYSLRSTLGYRYKDTVETTSAADAEALEQTGWTFDSVVESDWSDWSLTQDAPADTVAIYEERDPDPVSTPFYRYSHWKYTDGDTVICAAAEVEGTDGVWETIELEEPLSIVAFVSGAPAYLYNGERWFTQTVISKDVVPDYKLYRYKTQTNLYYKWTDWTTDAPAPDEARVTQSSTVYYYAIPVMHVITVHPEWTGVSSFSMLAYDGALADIGNGYYEANGYTVTGYYLDAAKTVSFALDTQPITASIDIFPAYEAKTFTIVFQYDNGEVIDTQTVSYCDNAVEPQPVVPDGYIFIGWDSDAYIGVDADAEVTAIFRPANEVSTIYLNRDKVYLYEESMIRIRAYTSIPNTPVTWTSSNYDVADVDENGIVMAVSCGTAVITATTPDRMSASCTVIVQADVDNSIILKNDAVIGFDTAGYVRGVKAGSNTVDAVAAQFENTDLVFRNAKGEVITGSALVTTGSVVEIVKENIVIDARVFIITGDANCDGKINNRDVVFVMRYLVNKEQADSECRLLALDANGDGEVNNRDAVMLARYLVGKEVL